MPEFKTGIAMEKRNRKGSSCKFIQEKAIRLLSLSIMFHESAIIFLGNCISRTMLVPCTGFAAFIIHKSRDTLVAIIFSVSIRYDTCRIIVGMFSGGDR